jgi:hypothetical protein
MTVPHFPPSDRGFQAIQNRIDAVNRKSHHCSSFDEITISCALGDDDIILVRGKR